MLSVSAAEQLAAASCKTSKGTIVLLHIVNSVCTTDGVLSGGLYSEPVCTHMTAYSKYALYKDLISYMEEGITLPSHWPSCDLLGKGESTHNDSTHSQCVPCKPSPCGGAMGRILPWLWRGGAMVGAMEGRAMVVIIVFSQDEPELVMASLWHTVAVNSRVPFDRLDAYQRAIQSLKVWCLHVLCTG